MLPPPVVIACAYVGVALKSLTVLYTPTLLDASHVPKDATATGVIRTLENVTLPSTPKTSELSTERKRLKPLPFWSNKKASVPPLNCTCNAPVPAAPGIVKNSPGKALA